MKVRGFPGCEGCPALTPSWQPFSAGTTRPCEEGAGRGRRQGSLSLLHRGKRPQGARSMTGTSASPRQCEGGRVAGESA